MTKFGWVFMLVSVSAVLALFVTCVCKTLKLQSRDTKPDE